MDGETALIFYYLKGNLNSYNALAGALEKYPDIKNIDVYFLSSEKELLQKISAISKKHRETIIGISFCTPQFLKIKDLINRVKKLAGETVFLAGGPHPAGAPLETLKLGFDFVISGEGEETLTELLSKINHD